MRAARSIVRNDFPVPGSPSSTASLPRGKYGGHNQETDAGTMSAQRTVVSEAADMGNSPLKWGRLRPGKGGARCTINVYTMRWGSQIEGAENTETTGGKGSSPNRRRWLANLDGVQGFLGRRPSWPTWNLANLPRAVAGVAEILQDAVDEWPADG